MSLTKDNSKVHFFEDPYKGHQYVEIGGFKWATMNIGASQPSDYGLYFAWGDTQGYTATQVGSGEGQKYFAWADYKYGNGTSDPGSTGMTKYNSTDGKTVLEVSDDAVTAAWGGQWHMPTTAEYAALGNAVNTAWTADYQGSGVAGLVCTDKTDSSKKLFFPACGAAGYGHMSEVGGRGGYWSSSLKADNGFASLFFFYNSLATWGNEASRLYGYPVRGVFG